MVRVSTRSSRLVPVSGLPRRTARAQTSVRSAGRTGGVVGQVVDVPERGCERLSVRGQGDRLHDGDGEGLGHRRIVRGEEGNNAAEVVEITDPIRDERVIALVDLGAVPAEDGEEQFGEANDPTCHEVRRSR